MPRFSPACFRVLTLASCLVLATSAHAGVVRQYFHVTSGTGFFVSNNGWAITNEHVVHGCDTVYLKGDSFQESQAEVRATDPEHDLALLFTPRMPVETAPLRDNIDALKAGDKVLVMGYPGDAGFTGHYQVVDAQMVDVHGPQNHPDWIQFSDAAQQGNSGGPLLDDSGNVLGVVVAKSQTFQVNPQNGEKTLVSKSDVAISLATVKDFLEQHGVYFRGVWSDTQLEDSHIENTAKDFIVNVQCRKPADASEIQELSSGSVRVIEMPPTQR